MVGRQVPADNVILGAHVCGETREESPLDDDVSVGGTVLEGVLADSQLDKVEVVNDAVECEDCSGDESTISLEEDINDDDLATDGGGMVAAATMQAVPTFGSISVTNSSAIHFGNKTVYQGPVTIKQLVYANGKEPIGDHVDEENFPGVNSLPSSKGAQEVERRDALKVCLGQATRRRRYLACFMGVAGVLVLSVVLTLVLIRRDAPNKSTGELFYKRPNGKYDTTLSGKLRILPRKEWLAQPPSEPYTFLDLPVPYVIISHTATEPCFKQSECVFAVRTVQTFHIESKGWSDIAYNFLVGGDGYVYTGRGWDVQGAHTFGYNKCGLAKATTTLSCQTLQLAFR